MCWNAVTTKSFSCSNESRTGIAGSPPARPQKPDVIDRCCLRTCAGNKEMAYRTRTVGVLRKFLICPRLHGPSAIFPYFEKERLSSWVYRRLYTVNVMKVLKLASESACGGSASPIVSRSCSTEQIHKNFLDQELVENEWKRRFRNTKYLGDAIFVLGPMGAGKTTIINSEFKSHPVYGNYAYVDTDEIMGMLRGFEPNKVESYYLVARNIAIRLTDWILDEKISFVAEGTCVKYLELIDYMARLKVNGYTIRVRRLPYTPVERVLEQAKQRKNRQIPSHVVASIFEGSCSGLEKLYQYNRCDNLFEDVETFTNGGRSDDVDSASSTVN